VKYDFVFKQNCVELYKNGQWPKTQAGIGQNKFETNMYEEDKITYIKILCY
jgi:transposase